MNLKIVFVVLISFVVGFTSLYVVNLIFLAEHDLEKQFNPIFEDSFDNNGRKVYVLGDSRIGVLNYTFINNYLHENGYDVEVYKMGVPGARAVDRLPILDTIISTKPDLVLIGAGLVDWQYLPISGINNEILNKPKSSFFDTQQFFENQIILGKFLGIDFYNFKNPKLTSLKIIDMLLPDGSENQLPPFKREPMKTIGPEKMQEQLKIHGFKGRISTENNPNTVALEIIIDKLEKNEIKVAIFILPRHQMFLDTVPHIEKINFFDNIDQIKGKTDVQIYSLFDKYAEQDIWQDHVHVTNGPKGIIYSEDVIKMIIQELIT